MEPRRERVGEVFLGCRAVVVDVGVGPDITQRDHRVERRGPCLQDSRFGQLRRCLGAQALCAEHHQHSAREKTSTSSMAIHPTPSLGNFCAPVRSRIASPRGSQLGTSKAASQRTLWRVSERGPTTESTRRLHRPLGLTQETYRPRPSGALVEGWEPGNAASL